MRLQHSGLKATSYQTANSKTDGAIAFHCFSASCSINQWEALENRASKNANDRNDSKRFIKQNPKPCNNVESSMNPPLHKDKGMEFSVFENSLNYIPLSLQNVHSYVFRYSYS